MLRHVSCQLEGIHRNTTDRSTTLWLYSKRCLQGIQSGASNYRENMCTIQQWISHEVEINHHLKNGPFCFWICIHTYHLFSLLIQTEQISHNVDNFPFLILQKHQQNGLKTNQTKGVWLKKCNGQDAATR